MAGFQQGFQHGPGFQHAVTMMALTQSRAGIARAGATRAGYYIPNPVILIGGVNRTLEVDAPSMTITLVINDEPDSARFTLIPNGILPLPVAGQPIVIGLGTAVDPIFGGQIVDVEPVWHAAQPVPWLNITCTDWTGLFNRRRITADFSGQSATDIVRTIVSTYTSGFTTNHVATGLPVLDEFTLINAEPLAAISRLAILVSGGCYIDGSRDVHVWGPGGETGYLARTNPTRLVNGLETLRDFAHRFDYTQIRTKVIVEGISSRTLAAVPAGADSIPLEYAWMFEDDPAPDPATVRVGHQRLTYTAARGVSGISGRPAGVVSVDGNPGDTQLQLVSVADIDSTPSYSEWFHDSAGNLFRASTTNTVSNLLTTIPASGYGRIQTVIPAGTAVYMVDSLLHIPASGVGAITSEIPVGEAVTVRVERQDAVAQATIAAIEGEGDGIYEHVISDGALAYDAAAHVADAELAAFKNRLLFGRWVTQDMNALPGTQQSITNIGIPGVDEVSGVVTITSVTIDFPLHNQPPRRACEGGTVKVGGILEAIRAAQG